MRKVLCYVGHYDYLIYNMLYDSALVRNDTNVDYIVLGTKNSNDIVQFIKGKEKNNNEFGQFALMRDEEFLGKENQKATMTAIFERYEETFRKFGTKLEEYDHIYMSFDEWNSFGLYLESCEKIPPVTVFLKHENQLRADIYHFLDSSGMFHFSSLQRKFRVLNAEASYISDYVVVRDGFENGDYFGKPMKKFDVCDAIEKLETDLYNRICKFFHFNPSIYKRDNNILVVGDSYWFERKNSLPDEYVKVYQTLLDHLDIKDANIIFKVHPRYSLGVRERDLLGCMRISGIVPVELLANINSVSIDRVYSVGNGVPYGVTKRATTAEVIDSRLMFSWEILSRLDCVIQIAEKNGIKKVSLRNIEDATGKLYTYLYARHTNVEILFENPEGEDIDTCVVYRDVDEDRFNREILPLVRQNRAVFILNPEFQYALADKADSDYMNENMVALSLKKYKLLTKEHYDHYEYMIWAFCQDTVFRERIEKSIYTDVLNYSGYRMRISSTPQRRDLIIQLPVGEISKTEIKKKAETSTVIIYGATSLAFEFVQKYEKILNIRYVMVDTMKNVNAQLKKKYKVILFSEADIRESDYIIVCKSFVHNTDIIPRYAQARDDLLRAGYHVGRKFTYYKIYDAIVCNMPIMLFCGYCELGGIKQILDLTSAKNDYCMLFYHIGRETMLEAPGYEDFVATVKLCDILIHAPLLVSRGVMDADVLKMISPNTKLIFVPQISFRGYAPYKSPKFTRRNLEIRLFDIVRYPFLYQIDNVNEMIIDGLSNEEIIKELKREDLFSETEIKNNLTQALRILQIMDAKSDIPIYDYIENTYRKELVFKDCIHANDNVFFEYARRLSTYLEKSYHDEINEVQRKCKESGAYFQVASEEPILPCVAKVLGLEFATEDFLYMEKITEERIRMRNFDEWINDYCDYYRAVVIVNNTLNKRYKTQKVKIFRNEEKQYLMEEV